MKDTCRKNYIGRYHIGSPIFVFLKRSKEPICRPVGKHINTFLVNKIIRFLHIKYRKTLFSDRFVKLFMRGGRVTQVLVLYCTGWLSTSRLRHLGQVPLLVSQIRVCIPKMKIINFEIKININRKYVISVYLRDVYGLSGIDS